MTKTLPLFLGVNAVLFAAFGVAAFAMPTTFASMLDFTLATPAALADFRAVYGGISFAIAAFSVMGLRDPKMTLSAVWLLTLTMDGLILGRLISTVVSGPGNVFTYGQLGLEVFGAVWGLMLIRASRTAQDVQRTSNIAAHA